MSDGPEHRSATVGRHRRQCALPPRPPTRSLLALIFGLVAQSALTPAKAAADGYNTWPGGLVGWGELEMSPQLELGLPADGRLAMPLMLQAGLTEGFDLALNVGLELGDAGPISQPMLATARWGLGDNATAGVGAGWQLDTRGASASTAMGVATWAWEPGGAWRGDSNLFVTTNLNTPRWQTTVDALAHVERRLLPTVSAVLEVNVQVAALPSEARVAGLAFLGVHLRPDRCDCVTAAVGYPVAGPGQHPRRAIAGFWWNHVLDLGFGGRGCRRPALSTPRPATHPAATRPG